MLVRGRHKQPKQQLAISSKTAVEVETVLGPNTDVQGDIRSSGGVRIDGDLSGAIDIAGNLVIGEKATVVANISARNVQIQGTVQGNVSANRLEILDTGKLWGDITVESFVLDDGGFFQGQSKMRGQVDPPLLEALYRGQDDVVDVKATLAE